MPTPAQPCRIFFGCRFSTAFCLDSSCLVKNSEVLTMTNESVSNVTDHASPAVILQQVPCDHPDFLTLCQELDRFLNRAIGGEDKREKYKKFNVLATMDHVVLAYDGQTAVGCAALRRYSEQEVEVKRVFVRKSYRGRNIGGQMLSHLITQAEKMGFQ